MLICPVPSCGHSKRATGSENFTCLQLDIQDPRIQSLQGVLDKFQTDQPQVELRGWACERCPCRANPIKQNSIVATPRLLFLHFKRFRTEFHRGRDVEARQSYVDTYIACEEFITLGSDRYRQIARIYFQGNSLHAGHYFAICRHTHTHPSGNYWYYNDTTRRLERPGDDKHPNNRVYACFYERVS